MMDSRVSICVPVYGVEKYIEKCARSLFAQTYPDIEYIFVDDCSKDKSAVILEQVIAEYPDKVVKLVRHKNNRGLAAARNTAVAASQGVFIMHVDSDDWLEPDAVEVLMARQLETGADIVSGNALAHFYDREEELIEPNYSSVNEMVHQVIKLTIDHVIWRRIIRRSLYVDNEIEAIEGLNIGEDHYTLPRLVYYAKSIESVGRVVYHYNCMNENSYMWDIQSQRKKMNRLRSNLDSMKVLLAFFRGKDDSCVKQLSETMMLYASRPLFGILRNSNKEAFNMICKDMLSVSDYAYVIGWTPEHIRHISKHYWLYWLKVRYRVFVRIITGKKNYTL